MRNISFAITKQQVKARTKTVTRRVGWHDLKPGTILQGVEKAQGLKKGEKVKPLCKVRVVSVTPTTLLQLTEEDVVREGFPGMSLDEFVTMFCKSHKGCTPATEITRIEFEYVD
jgi:hypothetical protein